MKNNKKSVSRQAVMKEWKHLPLLLTFIYLVLAIVGIHHHEMWRDEYQAWLIASNSHGLSELVANFRLEGHPFLWYFLLFLAKNVYNDPISMQYLHVAIATLSVYLISRNRIFSITSRVLFVFGYFMFFEYALISRSYILGLLLLFIFCTLYKNKVKNLIYLGLSLFFLANTNIYGLLLSMILGLFLLADMFLNKESWHKKGLYFTYILVGTILLVLSGYMLSVIQILPEANNAYPLHEPKGLEPERLGDALTMIFYTYIPFPRLDSIYFWNTSIFHPFMLSSRFNYVLIVLASLFLILFFTYQFRKNKLVSLFFLIGSLGITALLYYTKMFHLRYTGHLYMLLIACMWLFYSGNVKPGKSLTFTFTLILAIQFLSGIYAYGVDYKRPFSNIKETGEYIRDNNLHKGKMVYGSEDFFISPISALIKQPIFLPESDTLRNFMVWDTAKKWSLDIQTILKGAVNQVHQGNDSLILILSKALHFEGNKLVQETPVDQDVHVKLIRAFEKKCITRWEIYYVYWVFRVEKE